MKPAWYRNEIISHLIVTFAYFLLVSILRWKIDLGLIAIWFGGIIGTYLLDIDHLLYWYILHPEADDSRQAKILFKNQDYKGIYQLLSAVHQSHTKLIFHTALLQIVLLILSVYVLTSGGSVFGSALIMAANLHLLKDVWHDYFARGKTAAIEWFFWQIKGVVWEKYITIYLSIASLVFLGLSYLLI